MGREERERAKKEDSQQQSGQLNCHRFTNNLARLLIIFPQQESDWLVVSLTQSYLLPGIELCFASSQPLAPPQDGHPPQPVDPLPAHQIHIPQATHGAGFISICQCWNQGGQSQWEERQDGLGLASLGVVQDWERGG